MDVAKEVFVNIVTLSGKRYFVIPFEIIQLFWNVHATLVVVVSAVMIALVIRKYLSVLTTTYWFPILVFGSAPNVSIPTDS